MLFSRQNFVTYALTKTAILVNLSSPVIKFKIDIPMDSFISDHAASTADFAIIFVDLSRTRSFVPVVKFFPDG